MLIVYSYYVLDIVHRGHLLMMRNCKKLAGPEGRLVVGILTDEAVMEKKSIPILSFDERIALAEAIEYVDLVVPQETYSPLPNIRKIRPDILAESPSHGDKAIQAARDCMEDFGGRVVVLPYFPIQSSTKIKEKVKKEGN